MKRWLVVLLITLAVVVLISPGIVGRMAEQNIENSIAWAEADSPGLTVAIETFQRGWFTSEGRYRIDFEDGQFQDAADLFSAMTGGGQLPSLVIDSRLDHGLVPVTSLGRDKGSLAPSLASTVSTLQLDGGNGELIEIPGALYSNVSLAGTSEARLLLEPAEIKYESATIEWQGADLTLLADPSALRRSIDGVVQSISLVADGVSASMGSLNVTADQTATTFGLNTGNVELSLANIAFEASTTNVSIDAVSINGNSDIKDGRMSGTTTLVLNTLAGPTGEVDIQLQLSFSKLDALSFGEFATALRQAEEAGYPQTEFNTMYPIIEDEMQALLRQGVEIRIDQLKVSLPQGVLTTSLSIDVAETDSDDEFSWPGVILGTTASMDLRVPVALYDMAAMMNPEANSLVALGILIKDGSDYVMDADYEKGLINVNGAPMPIPIPGL